MNNKRFGVLSSSVNSDELALTVTSGARLVLGLLAAGGILTTTGADTVIEQIPMFVAAGYATWQGLEMLWGILRKMIVAISAQ